VDSDDGGPKLRTDDVNLQPAQDEDLFQESFQMPNKFGSVFY
jgi:hypothetical protein